MTAYEKYTIGLIPHIHTSDDTSENIFSDALTYQAQRILQNLQDFFPKKTKQQIIKMMFYKDEIMEEKKCHNSH